MKIELKPEMIGKRKKNPSFPVYVNGELYSRHGSEQAAKREIESLKKEFSKPKKRFFIGTMVFAFCLLSLTTFAQSKYEKYYEESANIISIDAHKVVFQESHLTEPDTVFHLGKLAGWNDTMNSFEILILAIDYNEGERETKYILKTFCINSPSADCGEIQ